MVVSNKNILKQSLQNYLTDKDLKRVEDLELEDIRERIKNYRKSGQILNNPRLFAKTYFNHLMDSDVKPFHEEWLEVAEREERACILAPRDHAKSTYFSLIYPILNICRNRDVRIFIVSNTHYQAQKYMRSIRGELEANTKLINDFGEFKESNPDLWSKQAVEVKGSRNKKDPTVAASGIDNVKLGNRSDLVIVDDPIERSDCRTKRRRDSIEENFFDILTNYLEETGGKIFVIGTRQHELDIYGVLKDNPSYFFKQYDAIVDERTKETLWPEKWNYERLMERKEETSSVRFKRNFRNILVDEESSMFPGKLMDNVLDDSLELVPVVGKEPPKWVREKKLFMGCDLATSAGTGADYCVFLVLAVDNNGNRILIHIYRDKGRSFTQQGEKIKEMYSYFDFNGILIESNQYQTVLPDTLKEKTDLPIKKHTTGMEKHDEQEGINALRTLFENEKFIIPYGEESREKVNVLLGELENMVWEEGRVESLGSHDDTVMALWLTNLAIKKFGIKNRFEVFRG